MTELVKNELLVSTINRLSHEGRGIGALNRRTVFLDGALPGEEVSWVITKKHSRYYEGKVQDILTSSEARVEPRCPHFLTCGGCNFQHLAAQQQLEFKQAIIAEQLSHFGKVSPVTWLPPLQAETYGYRRKARLGVKYVAKKGGIIVGFREKNSNYLADLRECHSLHPRLAALLIPLKNLVQTLSAQQEIPQIEMALGDNYPGLIFRNLVTLDPADQQKIIEFCQQHQVLGFLQPKGPQSITLLTHPQAATCLNYRLEDFNLSYEFLPQDFVQVNAGLNQLLVQEVIAQLDLQPHHQVLDLFCGLGNFSLALAKFTQAVTGVEGCSAMVARAQANAELNQLPNASFHVADLSQDCSQFSWAQQRYDRVLLDPARSGALEILPLVAQTQAQIIAYVSCNPATLARDLGVLVNDYGYVLSSVRMLDMFSQTAHIEALAILKKSGN